MDEADILSTKIGIIVGGVLRVFGTPLHLKRKYGRGFKLFVSFVKPRILLSNENLDSPPRMSRGDSLAAIEALFPVGKWKKLEHGGVTGSATYEFDEVTGADVDDGIGTVSRVLEAMDLRKEELGVEDWGLSQSSLEEVFMNIVKDDDADATQ